MLISEQQPGYLWFYINGKPIARISKEEWDRTIRTTKIEDCPICRKKPDRK